MPPPWNKDKVPPPNPKPRIDKVSRDGKIHIKFSEPIKAPNFG